MKRILCIALLVTGCEARQDVEIPFSVQFDGSAVDCVTTMPRLSDLRLYVHDVVLRRADGERVPLRLLADGAWQSDSVALVDLETGVEACDDGTPGENAALRASMTAGDYAGLEFTLGVPFSLNHADPLTAEAPLDDPAMHWHWRSGYKFLRAGVETDDDGFWLHLGSTGCKGTTGNITGCRSPNRFTVVLDDFSPGQDGVLIDLAALFASVDLADGEAGDCSSGPTEASCDGVLETFAQHIGDVFAVSPGRP